MGSLLYVRNDITQNALHIRGYKVLVSLFKSIFYIY